MILRPDAIGLELGVARVALHDHRVDHVVHRALERLGQRAELLLVELHGQSSISL